MTKLKRYRTRKHNGVLFMTKLLIRLMVLWCYFSTSWFYVVTKSLHVYYDYWVYIEVEKWYIMERCWDHIPCGGTVGAWYFVRVEACTQCKITTWSNTRCPSFKFVSDRCWQDSLTKAWRERWSATSMQQSFRSKDDIVYGCV